jgi:FKBP-type peptidyl-prolyl cis-trans isomerase (trigger factor)
MPKANFVVAKLEDSTIQITFTISHKVIEENRKKVLEEISEEIEVPGFRKGKAPLEKVEEKVGERAVVERLLSNLLPQFFSEAVKEHSLKPIFYPKFELIKAELGKDWEIRAITCEAPAVDVGDYRKYISEAIHPNQIWTPGSDNSKKTMSKEEKEQIILKKLLENAKVKVPGILIDEDVSMRLSNLLSRLEKLGLSLEKYLSSLGKTSEALREEYRKQSEESLMIDFILSRIAELEKIEVKESEIDNALASISITLDTPDKQSLSENRQFVKSILKKRHALDLLINL